MVNPSQRKNPNLKYNIFILFALVLVSCTHNEVFFEFHSLKNADWNREDPGIFEVNITDNQARYDVSVEVRNDDNYSFQNIWLSVDIKTPQGNVRKDTISADLADIYGKWYGKGISIHSLSIPYETGIQYPDTGKYVYTIRQGMRENPLKGISDIGLKISKNTQ